ncbi:putative short-chain dehydrogenases/reductase [Umbelopsis sp. AD052]|nr:putative short-chain dehydrogenases/reductase [Umbelopsis sp. AD052]
MTSYLVTGASRGIGLEFIRQLSQDPNNTVIALVRSAAKSVYLQEVSDLPNVHVVEGDVTSVEIMKKAAESVAAITGGSLDYIIENAGGAYGADTSFANPNNDPSTLVEELKGNFELNAVSGVITTNAFLPLLRKGKAKKIIFISSAIGDIQFTRVTGFAGTAAYGVGKAALNFIAQKYASELAAENFVVLALSPGFVDTSSTKEGEQTQPSEEDMKNLQAVFDQWVKSQPDWDRKPLTVQDSVTKQLKVISTVGPKDSGKLLSQNGNTAWL